MALTHLRRGDVVFTADATGSAMHGLITLAQKAGAAFGDGHANSVHAAIATGNGFEVVESVGSGLRARALRNGNYRVYCYRGAQQDEVRDAAAMIAESYVAQKDFTQGYGRYDKTKAAVSPFRASGGHMMVNAQTCQFGDGAFVSNKFFCSNMVWRCYAAAAEVVGLAALPIANSHAQLSPRDLEGLLISDGNWHARNNGASMGHP
jgi:hypothetical protein